MTIKSTREAAVAALLERAAVDPRLVVVSSDSLLAGRMVPFKKRYPDRLVEVGIAEQCAVDVAAGLATTGLTPVVISYAGFLTMRACEMVRTFVAYPGLNVKLVGLNGGMFGGEREGVTHQFYEDVGIMRSMPGVTVLTPCDAGQARQAALAMFEVDGPVYLRLGSGREPEVFPPETPFTLGAIREVKRYGDDVALFASGFIMNRALAALDLLREEGIDGVLVDVPTVKPLDAEAVGEVLRRVGGRAVAVEDHNIYGGLASAICEAACQYHPSRVVRLGLQDVYPRSGHPDALLDAYHLAAKDIADGARQAMRG